MMAFRTGNFLLLQPFGSPYRARTIRASALMAADWPELPRDVWKNGKAQKAGGLRERSRDFLQAFPGKNSLLVQQKKIFRFVQETLQEKMVKLLFTVSRFRNFLAEIDPLIEFPLRTR